MGHYVHWIVDSSKDMFLSKLNRDDVKWFEEHKTEVFSFETMLPGTRIDTHITPGNYAQIICAPTLKYSLLINNDNKIINSVLEIEAAISNLYPGKVIRIDEALLDVWEKEKDENWNNQKKAFNDFESWVMKQENMHYFNLKNANK